MTKPKPCGISQPFLSISFGFKRLYTAIRFSLQSTCNFTFKELPRATISNGPYKRRAILPRSFQRLVVSLSYVCHSSPAMTFRAVFRDSTKMFLRDVRRKRLISNSLKTKRLIQPSTPELFGDASTLPLAGQSVPRFLLVCWATHNRYGTTIASRLLSSQARWNPPEVEEDTVSRPAWFQTPVTRIGARLIRVDTETTKWSCNMYVAPGSIPKNKRGTMF